MQTLLQQSTYLIVDDFGDMRSMLRSMLSLFGITRIDTAKNGSETIHLLERKKYDVILCDYNLGAGKDGQQILEEARHRKLINLSTVFVMITAENTTEMVLGAIEYEPDAYLSKPFTKDTLRNRLEKILEHKQDLAPVDAAIEQGAFSKAIHLLEQSIAKKPKNLAELTRLKAELCYRAGAYDDAAVLYEKILSVREVPWASLGLGKVFYAKKKYQEAREIFRNLIYDSERMTVAYDWLAKTHQALGNLQEAQEVLAAAVELSPKTILRQRALGEVALKNKDFKNAERAFENAVTLGKFSVYKHPVAYAKLAESKVSNEDNKDKKAALGVIRQMEREFGKDREAQLCAPLFEAMVQEALGDEEAANQCMEQASQLYERLGLQGNSTLTLEMAKTSARFGDMEKAKALFKHAVRNNHDDDEFLREVEAAYGACGLPESPAELIASIKGEIVELNNRGVKLAKSGQIQAAIGLFEEAAEGMSGNKVVNLNAAKVLIMQMEQEGTSREYLNRARKYIDRTRKINPDDSTLAQVVDKFQRLVADA